MQEGQVIVIEEGNCSAVERSEEYLFINEALERDLQKHILDSKEHPPYPDFQQFENPSVCLSKRFIKDEVPVEKSQSLQKKTCTENGKAFGSTEVEDKCPPQDIIFFGGIATLIEKESPDCTVYRCQISSQTEADLWLKYYKMATYTEWIVTKTFPNAKRCLYHKKYQCFLGKKNKKTSLKSEMTGKTRVTGRNKNCSAILSIKIKLNSRNSRKNDDILKRYGYQGIVTVSNIHSHPIKAVEILKLLRYRSHLEEIRGSVDKSVIQAVNIKKRQKSRGKRIKQENIS